MTEELAKLTPRQTEILELVAKGFTNIEIGELLELSAGTVKVHVSAIIERLDVTNRTEAATIWLRQRLSSYLSSNKGKVVRGAVCVFPFESDVDEGEAAHFATWARADICEILKKNNVALVDEQTAGAVSQAGLTVELVRENLGASFIVDGRVDNTRKAPVISVSCRDTVSGEIIFSSIYEVSGNTPDISFLDIAIDILKHVKPDDVATALAPQVGDGANASREEFWRGRHCFGQRTPASLLKSCEHFKKSIEMDPEFTEAYVGLANAAHQIGYYGEAAQSFFYEMGREAANSAVALDPMSARAHGALAYSQFVRDWNFGDAAKSFERARHLDPNYDEALMWYSLHSMIVGEPEKCLALAKEGLSKNPMAIPHFVHVGHVYRSQNRLDDAIKHLNIAVEMDPAHIRANIWLALTLADSGAHDVAQQLTQRILAANGRVSTLLGISGYIAGLAGDEARCVKLVEEIKSLPGAEKFGALYIAFCLIGIGEEDEALKWIWQALDQRPPLILGWQCDPIFLRLREHNDFDSVANAIGLPFSD